MLSWALLYNSEIFRCLCACQFSQETIDVEALKTNYRLASNIAISKCYGIQNRFGSDRSRWQCIRPRICCSKEKPSCRPHLEPLEPVSQSKHL